MKIRKDRFRTYLFSLSFAVMTLVMMPLSWREVSVTSRDSGRNDVTSIARVSVLTRAVDRVAQAGAVSAETAPVVPERLKVPMGQALSLQAQAAGVQIYECDLQNDDPTRFVWNFRAAEAELFNSSGESIGRHYAGPTWESKDGSKVVAEVRALYVGPDPNAIPWLLLSATSNTGNVFGVFGGTQTIQRVRTSGGKAPAQSCNRAQRGKEMRQPFKATFYFYVR